MLGVLAFSGCESRNSGLAPVEGTVTFDDKPLAEARIIFEPEGGGMPSESVTDENGYYKLHYSGNTSGAEVDTHIVKIRTSGMENGAKEIIPARYNAESELKETVTKDSNTINFDLKSGGKIVHIIEDSEDNEEL